MNGHPVPSSRELPDTLIKKIYGIANQRGGTTWQEQCPEYLQEPVAKDEEHALVLRYKESKRDRAKKTIDLTSIDIQSSYLKDVLREVFHRYPGADIEGNEMSFDAPFQPFVHQWTVLEAIYERERRADGHFHKQIAALIRTLTDEIGENIKNAQSVARNGNITFAQLWSIYPPGCPVFGDYRGKRHCFLVHQAKYLSAEVVPVLSLELLFLDHNGDRYGWGKIRKSIDSFAGSVKISGLVAVPAHFQQNLEDALKSLRSRGESSAELIGDAASPSYRAYSGPVRLHKGNDLDEIEIFVEGRIMLDPKSHGQQVPRYVPQVYTIPHSLDCLVSRDSYTNLYTAETKQYNIPSVMENLNQHPVLSTGPSRLAAVPCSSLAAVPCSSIAQPLSLQHHQWTTSLFGIYPESFTRSVVRGYCLSSKCWAEFETSCIGPISWNTNAFTSLVIPPAQKRLLEALVRQQQAHKRQSGFDDVVAGKGQGLIMLLAGPPGTGKTLTAESIADRLHLPLYAVSAHELGDSAESIEGYFGHVLRLAASWNAVLLLDEADAFLEKRTETENDMTARLRNKRVAAFLRILEYYKGILILTTNRRVNFDEAFHSRIHLSLTFKPLDAAFRESIWKNFIGDSDQISADELKQFAKEDLNGRQIKNIMKMARLLSKDLGDEAVRAEHVEDVLAVAKEDLQITSKA